MIKRWIFVWIGVFVVAAPTWADTPLETLTRLRSSYPTPLSSAQAGELLNRVAWEHRQEGFGLLSKTTGRMCMSPGGLPIACDILTQRLPSGFMTHFDVLADSQAAAVPWWNEIGLVDASRFVAPTNPLIPPPLPVVTVNLTQLEDQVTMVDEHLHGMSQLLSDRLSELQTRLNEVQEAIRALQAQVQEVAARPLPPFPDYHGRVLGFGVTLHPQP